MPEFRYSITFRMASTHRMTKLVYRTPAAGQFVEDWLAQEAGLKVNIDTSTGTPTGPSRGVWTTLQEPWLETEKAYDSDTEFRDVLACIHDLHLVADDHAQGLKESGALPDWAEDFIIEAAAFDVQCHFHSAGTCLEHPACQALITPEGRARAAHRQAERCRYTEGLAVLRLDNDHGGTGLWTTGGRSVPLDYIDLPAALVRQIALWQRHFDEHFNPYGDNSEEAAAHHVRAREEISAQLREALNPRISVQIWQDEQWTEVARQRRSC